MRIINITDITEYLYCQRKVYLKLVKGIKSPPNQRMINGMLRHKVFDIFNKNEKNLIENIKEKINEEKIRRLYEHMLVSMANEVLMLNENLARKFSINNSDFLSSIKKTFASEIELRIQSITASLNQGFLDKELWRELKPKYLTEYKILSEELGLQGRVDRVRFSDSILPVEIKTRDKIFESDKIQLAGYALLLEKEFGKSIGSGIIELLGNQQEIELTSELKAKVLEIAGKIRSMTEETAEFPSNFEKCRNCMLKENCD